MHTPMQTHVDNIYIYKHCRLSWSVCPAAAAANQPLLFFSKLAGCMKISFLFFRTLSLRVGTQGTRACTCTPSWRGRLQFHLKAKKLFQFCVCVCVCMYIIACAASKWKLSHAVRYPFEPHDGNTEPYSLAHKHVHTGARVRSRSRRHTRSPL